ncbi:hypothetical protein L3Q82_019367, partial [Scortum barcoo]
MDMHSAHYQKQRTRLNSVAIRGTEVDIVDSYKYLGVHLDNKLDRTINTDAIYKKGQSLLVFPQEAQIFQHLQDHAADSLGGIQRHLLRCSVLGQQAEDSRQTQQAHQESWICPG